MFGINCLDHVAIRVKDIDLSAKWYEKVLGLKRLTFEEWGGFPVFMLAGKTGIAIFPAYMHEPAVDSKFKGIKIDHFAFNVSLKILKKQKSITIY
jgi:catechol 2,3-dioxygenase-like lactoylglutathione lyase family enzyme